jgi:hypothetical protein
MENTKVLWMMFISSVPQMTEWDYHNSKIQVPNLEGKVVTSQFSPVPAGDQLTEFFDPWPWLIMVLLSEMWF